MRIANGGLNSSLNTFRLFALVFIPAFASNHIIQSENVIAMHIIPRLLDGKKLRKPVFRMILTAVGDYAYARKEDGIIVCPISALKP